jgi:hypothetical protein
MNLKRSLVIGITISILLISTSLTNLAEAQEFISQDQMNLTTASLIDTTPDITSEIQPEALSYSLLMSEIDELNSGKIILENQSRQIDMSSTIQFADQKCIEECICSLGSYENMLRNRAKFLAKFEIRLKNSWQNLNKEQRIYITEYLEKILRSQSIFISDFQSQLKKKFCSFPMRSQKNFLDSQRDLLDRQANLLLGFEDFLHNLQDIEDDQKVEFLASFEDLIRRQAILLNTYQAFLKVKCNILKINKYVSGCGYYRPCQNVTYMYAIINTCNCTVEGIRIVDDQLGIIADNVSLGPHEKKNFSKTTSLNFSSGTTACNTAQAWGNISDNFIVMSQSNKVCVKMASPTLTNDSLKLGSQKAVAIATDPATAENNIAIVKNQIGKFSPHKNSAQNMTIGIGDQLAAAYRNSKGANNINIVSNQR